MLAILQCADQGPVESLAVMLRAVGWDVALPNEALRRELRSIGCDTVLDVESLVRGWGYERPFPMGDEAGVADMARPDVVYVDVKAHRNAPIVWKRWPNLKVLWYRINGGKPEHVVNARGDFGDEVNPPCPVLTPNQWYRDTAVECNENDGNAVATLGSFIRIREAPWRGRAYCCWPPFARINKYHDRFRNRWAPPVCLIHNLQGWGYGPLVDECKNMGVRFYGTGSPDGLIKHEHIPTMLSSALCMVHLKSSDAPGYALYEAMAASCPVIVTRKLLWKCRMEELLEPGVTCFVLDDRETHEGLTPDDVGNCLAQLRAYLRLLSIPENNAMIGHAGRRRLEEVMWNKDRDKDSLAQFLAGHYA